MKCEEILSRIELMADDEMSSEHAADVNGHIETCATCRDRWYEILALREAVKDVAATYKPTSGFEERLIASIKREARPVVPMRRYVALAAGLLVLGLAAATLLNQSPVKVTTSVAVAPPRPPVGTLPNSLEQVLDNFEAYQLAESGGGADLGAVSKEAGFEVKPVSLSGYKLASADIIQVGARQSPVVRLSYLRMKVKGKKSAGDCIICYQAQEGKLIAKGLNEHSIDGRTVCCGEVADASIVFIPGQKGQKREVLLVSRLSRSDLMDLYLSGS